MPRLRVQRDIMQNRFFGHISEIHIEHAHVAAKRRIGHGAVRRVRMLPSPHAGAFGGFPDIAVFIISGIDERDVTLVRLRYLVHQREDSRCARHRHRNRIDMLGGLVDVHGELACHIDERHHDRNAERHA